MLRMDLAKVANSIGRDDLGLSGAAIIAEEFSVSAAAIDDVGIGGIRRNITAFTSARGMPVTKCDGAIITAAQDEDAAAILLRAIDVVRKLVVHGNVIKLRRWLVKPTAPGAAAIHTYASALVTAKDHALRVAGINPESVIVVAAGRAFNRGE